jgi:hypothetical protein
MKGDVYWKVHTPRLFERVFESPGTWILRIPFLTLAKILDLVAIRCSELNDPILNKLMCDLTLYEIADPENENYNPKKVKEIEKMAKDKYHKFIKTEIVKTEE